MSIGIFPLAGKPVHKGHWAIIQRALRENDNVLIFASKADRKRPGEVCIKGSDMEKIWKECLIPNLPGNAKVMFVSNPVRSTYEYLDFYNAQVPVKLYVGKEDSKNRFSYSMLEKYLKDTVNLIEVVTTERITSGTELRSLLASGKRNEFINLLPEIDEENKDRIWDVLQTNVIEHIIRKNIRKNLKVF